MKLLIFSIIPQIISLVFFILASITAPTLTSIYLSKINNNNNNTILGIFGYCTINDNNCTSISIHTKFSDVISSSIINSNTLDNLSQYLIITPITAGLIFLSILFNIFAISFNNHLNYSKIYWIILIIIAILTFLTSAFICIIIFLIFYPNVQWLSWCLIPASIINFANLIISIISFKLLLSSNSFSNNNENEKDYSDNIIHSSIDENDFNQNSNLDLHSNIPEIDINKSTFLSHTRNSSISSFSNKEKDDKYDFNIMTEKINSNQNSSSNQSLKLPNISDPYNNDNNNNNNNSQIESNMNNNSNNFSINENSNNNSDHFLPLKNENISSNSLSSNFTSISQRPINPNYYHAPPARSTIPLNNNNNNYIGVYNQQPFEQRNPQPPQYNQSKYQLSSMPVQNKNAYMRNPKPYMMMNQRPGNYPNQSYNNNINRNMNLNMDMRNQPYQNFNNNNNNNNNNGYLNKQNYHNQQVRPMNSYAQPPPNQNYRKNNNNFIPMRYRNGNNMQNVPPSALNDNGPYSNF